MDLLSRREHSETEIRKKLNLKFLDDEIESAIEYGKKQGWIPDTQHAINELAEAAAEALHRKKKGIHFINKYLLEKGLPEVALDDQRELDKALALVENKLSKLEGLSDQEMEQAKARLGRFLMSRGFDLSTVQKVIYGQQF